MGAATGDQSSLIFLKRYASAGKLLWSTVRPASYDIFYTGPGKIQPSLDLAGDRLLTGAFRVDKSTRDT